MDSPWWPQVEVCIGNENSGFSFFSRGNGDRHVVIREVEWELLGPTWEWMGMGIDNRGKIPAQRNSFSHESRYEECTAWVKNNHPLFILLYSVYIKKLYWTISTIFGTEYIEKIFNTKVIDSPTSLTYFRTLFSPVVCGWFWKKASFWCWDEDADLGDGQCYCRCSKWSPWIPRRQSSAHATSAFSSCRTLQSFRHWAKLSNKK